MLLIVCQAVLVAKIKVDSLVGFYSILQVTKTYCLHVGKFKYICRT